MWFSTDNTDTPFIAIMVRGIGRRHKKGTGNNKAQEAKRLLIKPEMGRDWRAVPPLVAVESIRAVAAQRRGSQRQPTGIDARSHVSRQIGCRT